MGPRTLKNKNVFQVHMYFTSVISGILLVNPSLEILLAMEQLKLFLLFTLYTLPGTVGSRSSVLI